MKKEFECNGTCVSVSSFDVRFCEILMEDYNISESDLGNRSGGGYRSSLELANFAGTITLPQVNLLLAFCV